LGAAASGSFTSAAATVSAAPKAPSGAASSASALTTTTIGGTKVLTNARGFTLYMFAPDSATASKCNGSCAQLWPPVTGGVTAGPGVTGALGTITRADGSSQATYNGHPVYTYAGDTQPGQANGNGINGVWHEVTTSATVPSPAGTGGNGY
jgi:predicted lipoprotein with Yx(FWY)xxD motif